MELEFYEELFDYYSPEDVEELERRQLERDEQTFLIDNP